MESIKKRDSYYDNLKFLLISLVVIGHFAEFYTSDSTACRYIWYYIFIFHMPLFLMVTGLFLKRTIEARPFKIDKIISYLILCYFMKVTILLMYKYWFHYDNVEFSIFDRNGPWWFLFVVAVYIPLTHVLRNVKPRYVLIASILFALLVGYDDTVFKYMSLSKMIVAYPFFYAGYCIDKDKLRNFVKDTKFKYIGLLILAAVAILLYFNMEFYSKISKLSSMGNPYELLGINEAFGAVARLLFYGLQGIMMLAFMAIVPVKRRFWTPWGGRTLQIYLFHGYVVRILAYYGFGYVLMNAFGSAWLPIYMLSAIACTFILSFKYIEKPFKKVMTLKLNRIYREK